MGTHTKLTFATLLIAIVVLTTSVLALPQGFRETPTITGLHDPTAFRFAPDGSIFVAQKEGVIYHFDNINGADKKLVIDLVSEVDSTTDLGLLGLAVDPQYSNGRPYIYALYSLKNPTGNPGSRLVKLTITNEVSTNKEILLDSWCQSSDSHGIGDLHFGADGSLYVSAGEGADHNSADWGQLPSQIHSNATDNVTVNCGDPALENSAIFGGD